MRRTRHSNRNRSKVMSDINLTNLIDVTMTTLVCYMIIAPIVEQGIDVNLPRASQHKMESKEPIIVTVSKNETIYVGNKLVTVSQLTNQLQTQIKKYPDTSVIIKADKEISYGKVVNVLDELNNAGITKVGMATEINGK